MEWSHLVGSSSLWREFVVQVKFIIYHIFLGSCFTLKLLCMKFQTPAFQVARCLKPSLPSPALSLLGNPPSPQMPKSSLESYPARLQTKNLCFVFPDGKLVPLQRLARVLPVCVLHVSRLRLPSIPIKFASIAKSARCSTYHGAHRDSFSPWQPLQECKSSSAPTSYPKKENLRLSFSLSFVGASGPSCAISTILFTTTSSSSSTSTPCCLPPSNNEAIANNCMLTRDSKARLILI